MRKYKNLQGQTEIEAKASDHQAIVMGNICTFNLLCRCEKKTDYFNNGFAMKETLPEYRERLLNKLIPIISELIDECGVQILVLQEAPPMILPVEHAKEEALVFEIAKEFYSALKTLYKNFIIDPSNYLSMWRGTDLCGLFLIYDEVYKMEKNITEEYKAVISKDNKARFQAVQLYHKDHMLKLVNMHADFNNQEGTAQDIRNLVEKDFIVAGDFNLKNCPIINGISYVQTTYPGLMPCDTYDGFFVSNNIYETLSVIFKR